MSEELQGALLLSRDEVEQEYGLSRRWLELAAVSGNGPPYLKISRRMVRYRRDQLETWLDSRAKNHSSQ
jgi:predicted DNA-binding transcriptional regulator AlpA